MSLTSSTWPHATQRVSYFHSTCPFLLSLPLSHHLSRLIIGDVLLRRLRLVQGRRKPPLTTSEATATTLETPILTHIYVFFFAEKPFEIEMVKKQVPDWLNSSLWSSPAPPPPIESPPPQQRQQQPPTPPRSTLRGEDAANRPSRSSPKSANYSSESAVERPVIPVPPPVIRTEGRRTKAEIRDPLSSNNNNNTYNSDEDNASSTGSSTTPPSLAAVGSSADDISRQAQLCQEVYFSLYLCFSSGFSYSRGNSLISLGLCYLSVEYTRITLCIMSNFVFVTPARFYLYSLAEV